MEEQSNINNVPDKPVAGKRYEGILALVIFCIALFQHYIFPGLVGSLGFSFYILIILITIGAIFLLNLIRKCWHTNKVPVFSKIVIGIYIIYTLGSFALFIFAPQAAQVVFGCLATNGDSFWGGTRAGCIRQVAVKDKSYFYCSILSGTDLEDCKARVALATDDFLTADKFNSSTKDTFYLNEASKRGDPRYCNKTSEDRRISCYGFATDVSACLLIKDNETFRNDCVFEYAKRHFDPSKCDLLTDTYTKTKNTCKILSENTYTLTMDYCKLYTSPEDEFLCGITVGKQGGVNYDECQKAENEKDKIKFNSCILGIVNREKNGICDFMKKGEEATTLSNDLKYMEMKAKCENGPWLPY